MTETNEMSSTTIPRSIARQMTGMTALTPIRPNRPRILSWFSCGDASAVSTKLVLSSYGATHDIAIARCVIPEEHPDNDRFSADCEAWFGQPIINLRSADYASCQDVWERVRYMSGVNGAPCTREMKKAIRWAFEQKWLPDLQAFGYTSEERDRANAFRRQNPEVRLVTPLIHEGLDKEACHALVSRAGINLPVMYRLGFNNNNCIGCVKAQSPAYWNRVRRHFPEVFAARVALSRDLGVRLVKLPTGDRDRIFLDELDPEMGAGEVEPALDCSLLCYIAEQKIAEGAKV
jgi:hypothetical protein